MLPSRIFFTTRGWHTQDKMVAFRNISPRMFPQTQAALGIFAYLTVIEKEKKQLGLSPEGVERAVSQCHIPGTR